MNEGITTSVPLVPSAPEPSASTIRFTGARRDFRRLITRGALLEFVTLGFYRFWLTTDMRRHLWSHTEVGGDTAEYTGTAKELLIGFLIALAVLVPIYLTYFYLTLEAERWAAFASVPLLLFFYLFTQFAIYRARRYRLTRTIWRGVRFWMTGSGWNYAFRAFGWSFVLGLTLGLALPWMRASLERYKMQHTHYGDLPARFEGTGGEFFARAWWLWLLTWLVGWLIIPLPFIYGVFKAIEWRWWISGLRVGGIQAHKGRVGGVRAHSKLDASDLFDLYWKVIGWIMLIATVATVVVGGAAGAAAFALADSFAGTTEQQVAAFMQHPATLVLIGVGYLATALAAGIVMRLYLTHDLWQRVIDSTVVYNLEAADHAISKGELAGSLGEGLADSFDVGGM
jgi:uncharacterized membrane protein YjgN (DUF898 family)